MEGPGGAGPLDKVRQAIRQTADLLKRALVMAKEVWFKFWGWIKDCNWWTILAVIAATAFCFTGSELVSGKCVRSISDGVCNGV